MTQSDEAYEGGQRVVDALRSAAAGRREEAITELEQALATCPDHAFGRLHLALILCAEGRIEDAEPHLARALELEPENPAFHLFAGRVYFDAEDNDRARDAFVRVLELSPNNDLARGFQILTAWSAGAKDASDYLDPGDMPDSTPFLARLLMLIETEMKGKEAIYTNEGAAVPWVDGVRATYLLWRGGLAFKRGEFAQAAAQAEMISEMQPGHPGAVAFLRKCRDAALQAAMRRAEEAPESAEVRIELAGMLAEEERFEEADEALAEGRRLQAEGSEEEAAETPEILRLRGRIDYGLGRIDEAIERLRAGAEPGFSMAETNYYLGLCHLAKGLRLACVAEFEPLVEKVCWAVTMRFREYQAWKPDASAGATVSEAQTSS